MKKQRFIVCSDIHGNYQALKAVFKKVDRMTPETLICLGDVVGYGADPEACLNLLEEHNALILKGNHEAMLIGESDRDNCNALGQISNRWMSANCSEACQSRLYGLPFEYHLGEMDFYHSSTVDDGSWPYLNSVEQIAGQLAGTHGKFVFYSHTHRTRVTILDRGRIAEDRLIKKSETIVISKHDERKYIINVGSVGQQRDTRTNASFVCFCIDKNTYKLQFHRIPYDSYHAYRAVLHRGCGSDIAAYLIREPWRRKAYELFDHGCSWLRRKINN